MVGFDHNGAGKGSGDRDPNRRIVSDDKIKKEWERIFKKKRNLDKGKIKTRTGYKKKF